MLVNYGFCYLLLICSVQRSMAGQTQDGYVWQEDPDKHIQGLTYEKLQEVFQSYPVDRRRMDKHSFYDALFRNCHDLVGYRESVHTDTLGVSKNASTICSSILYNCRRLEASSRNSVMFCPSTAKDRMYDYMEITNRYLPQHVRVFGRNYRQCDPEIYAGYAFKPCLCECESTHREIDRYFSLFDVVADEDKVVTGVRVKKDNHVFHIQIQQGTAGPNFTIVDEAKWKAVDGITTYGLLSRSYSKLTFKGNQQVDLEFYENEIMYAITNEQRTILLDDLQAGPGEVVSGLRFRQVGKDLRLEIQVTPYSAKSGDIQPLASRWISNTIDKSLRKQVNLEHPGVPSEHAKTTSFSATNQYVRFQPSDLREDLGQTTVPFIDVQDVVADPPSPLLGVGIFHKGNKQSAGFIAFRGKYNERL